MLIELQKYSRLDEEKLLTSHKAPRSDSRLKVVGFVTVAVFAGLIGLTSLIGKTVFMASDDKAL